MKIILAFDLYRVIQTLPASCVVSEKCISCGHKFHSEISDTKPQF